MLFEPVRKTQDAMFFIKTSDGNWVPCGPNQPGAIQVSMQELAAKGLASKVYSLLLVAVVNKSCIIHVLFMYHVFFLEKKNPFSLSLANICAFLKNTYKM